MTDCRISFINSAFPVAYGVAVSNGTGNEVVNNKITNISCTFASSGGAVSLAFGVDDTSTGLLVANNTISNVTIPTSGTSAGSTSYGIGGGTFSVDNKIYNVQVGISTGGKYENNLTSSVTTPFSGGTAVGTNN